jgi:hypothetical protein
LGTNKTSGVCFATSLPKGTNFTITWRIEECQEATAIGYSFELIVNEKVDVLIAPPCIDGTCLTHFANTMFYRPLTQALIDGGHRQF